MVRPYPEAEIIEVQVNQIRGIDVRVNGTLLDFDLAISKVISVEGNNLTCKFAKQFFSVQIKNIFLKIKLDIFHYK